MPFIELVAQRRPPSAPLGMQPPENAKDWYRLSNSADETDTTDLYVYDAIGGWFGMYADDLIRDLKEVTSSRINLRINSPGGSVFEGIAIANALRAHPATVNVYVDSLAASIASVIALAGDKVIMMPQSQFMVHNASGACYGDATEMTKMADLLDKQSRNIADAYAQRTGKPVSEWQAFMAEETWFTADEAVAAGLADEIFMPPKKEEEKVQPASASAQMQRTWDLTAYRYAGRENSPAPGASFVQGGLVAPGLANGITIKPGELIVAPGAISNMSSDVLIEMIRNTVRTAVHDEIEHLFDSVAPSHSTAVQDGTWDSGAQEKRLPSPVPLATAKKMYTYWDESQAENGEVPKSACKLPHHFVSEDGTPGAASIAGVRNALARLPQTEGLSDAERSAAEAHLQKHLNAFKGAEDSEDPVTDEAPPEEDVEDADKKKKLPPFLQPDEDEEEDEDEDEKKKSTKNAEESGDDVEDSWSLVLARFDESPSPSADDVFNRLKEAWL